jgi:hypothetical protein
LEPRGKLQVPPFRCAPVGMTKFKSVSDLGFGYLDGEL